MPVLTVGLPVYNGAKWIEDALESILEQSLRDFDLVISDNASNDDTNFSLMAELSLRGKFVEIPDRLLLRRRDPEASAILTGAALPAAQAQGYPRPLDTLQRFNLHAYRFVTTFRAPIGFAEKLRVWYFLLWRVTWRHRRQALRKLFRIVTRGR